MNKTGAIYARVSSDRQKENQTITSQTAALKEYAASHDYIVPAEWVFEDEGYSGATLIRPGLEAMRDLAAQGQIEAVLVYSPDRLSRKYAYQVVLAEEFARCGVSLVFLKSPSGETPEDQLLVQFQGMIAEYERAQIAERSRRGKRYRAHQGIVNVLSGAPYGYRYVKKTDNAEAYYEVIEGEAEIVRMLFEVYTTEGLSINAIARLLNERRVPTRTAKTRWERSTVWGILRNPAYQGKACFGKTELRPRQRITRPIRQRNRLPSRNSANHERPRQDWIEIPVPALVSETIFALAQEQLTKNKQHAPRRTIEPTLLGGGMLVCEQCGYGLYRVSTHTSKHKLNYYRCIGSDGYRHLRGPVCPNRPIRQDFLDEFVWREIIRLLDDQALIQFEIDRRMEAARKADPLRKREQSLRQQQTRLENHIARLVTAYQEELITLAELRQRMPNLRKQHQTVESEIHSLEAASQDQSTYLRLAETLSVFRGKLRARAETLDVIERQKILRLVVQEILVGKDTIRIRHSIPVIDPGPSPIAPQGRRMTLAAASDQEVTFCVRGVISPLLSNIYLHWFDKVFHRTGGPGQWAKAKLVRYADDFVVLARYQSQQLAEFIESKLEGWMSLQLNREKTRIVHVRQGGDSLDFLGYTFRYERSWHGRWAYLKVQPSKPALLKQRAAVRALTASRYGFKPIPELIQGLNRSLHGWAAYFRFGHPSKAYWNLNYYVQQRLRIHLSRRSQRPYRAPEGVSLYAHLRDLGLESLTPPRRPSRLFT